MMEGASRGSWAHAIDAFRGIEATPGLDLRHLAGELFAVGEAIYGARKLRAALADPSRDAGPKRDLARRLFEGRISPEALATLEAAVSGPWRVDRDLAHALERLGVEAVLAAAERDGQLDRVEEELFRFERLVASDRDLHAALSDRSAPRQAKADLVVRLLDGKACPDTVWLAQRPVLHPRGRRFSTGIWRQLTMAARRREQITAIVTSAVRLTDTQRDRLGAALGRLYGRSVFVNTEVDPGLMGGVRIRIGDEVIDGSVLRRLENARRAMGVA